jgi:hypothetical protein
MRPRVRPRTLALPVLLILATLAVLAQPQTTSSARVDLSGKWTLDTYLSDHPAQVAAAIRADLGQPPTDQPFGPGSDQEGRFGRGDVGRRGGGGPRGGGRQNQPNAEEQKRLDALTAPLRYPPTTLTITQTATGVSLAGEQGQTVTLTANGKREKLTVGENTIETTTRWEGPLLVSEQDLGKGRKMTYTYSIVPTTNQLLVRVELERAPGQPGPFEIKQVYNRAR